MKLTPELLVEIEQIKQLKYRYLRAVDLKQWDLLASTLAEDATSSYSDGKHSYTGREEVLKFLTDALQGDGVVTKHQCHHPEITFQSEVEATGVWYLTDTVINQGDPNGNPPITLQGTGFYEDSYRKENGQWVIAHTGYSRVFEEIVSREKLDLLSFQSRWDTK